MPGTDVPVISPADMVSAQPERVLLLLPDLMTEVRAGLPTVEAYGGTWVDVASLACARGELPLSTARGAWMSAPRRVVVTGGAGFIGSTLTDRLLSEGWAVTAVDGFDPFYPRAVKEANIDRARKNPAFRLAEVDTRDRDALLATVEQARPEVIVDLAARAGVRPSIADPGAYVDLNVRGFQTTLAACQAVGARLVFASSSSVYGQTPGARSARNRWRLGRSHRMEPRRSPGRRSRMRTMRSPDCPLVSRACSPSMDRASGPTWRSTHLPAECWRGSRSPFSTAAAEAATTRMWTTSLMCSSG